MQSIGPPTGAQLAQQANSIRPTGPVLWGKIKKVTDFKNHSLSLVRIKSIMKADEDVRMISDEAPVVFVNASEMFILELTLKLLNHTDENKRTLQKNDSAAAITRSEILTLWFT